MGLLDIPAPMLSWTDQQLSGTFPDFARVVLWAALTAALSMAIYWLISPQRRLGRLAIEEQSLKEQLNDDAADWSEGVASARQLLRLALLRLALVLPPTIIAALPVVSVMAWLHTHYAYNMPAPSDTVDVRVVPPLAHGGVVAPDDAPPRVEVRDNRDQLLQAVPLFAAVPVLHKRLWWNALIGNPMGYLRDDAPVERIEIDLPEKLYLPVGPLWLRTWHTPFLVTLLVSSLMLRFLFRVR